MSQKRSVDGPWRHTDALRGVGGEGGREGKGGRRRVRQGAGGGRGWRATEGGGGAGGEREGGKHDRLNTTPATFDQSSATSLNFSDVRHPLDRISNKKSS